MKCSVEECHTETNGRYCAKHYRHFRYHGHPTEKHLIIPHFEATGNPELVEILRGKSIKELSAYCDLVLENGHATPPKMAQLFFDHLRDEPPEQDEQADQEQDSKSEDSDVFIQESSSEYRAPIREEHVCPDLCLGCIRLQIPSQRHYRFGLCVDCPVRG